VIEAAAYHVLSEFKFEIGEALIHSDTLRSHVDQLSEAVDGANQAFHHLGMGIVGHLGLGEGGALAFLYEAIAASEKFGATQRKLANIFLSNQNKIAGGPVTFLQAMEASSSIMDEILHKSRQFGLPAQPLAQMTALLGAPLFGAGAAGKNLAPAIDIARGVLKASPVLGVAPEQAQQEVVSMILGRGNIQDQFVNRIVQDTDVFRKLLGGHGLSGGGGHGGPGGALGAFNALSIDKRVKAMTDALLQFASSTEIVEANANSLTQQWVVLKDTLTGMFSLLKPFGDQIAKFIGPSLKQANQLIQTQGAAIVGQVAPLMGKILGSPEMLVENLFQAKQLKRDLASAGKVFSVAGIASMATWLLGKVGVSLGFVTPYVGAFAGALTIFVDIFERTPAIFSKFLLIGAGLTLLTGVLIAFPPLAGILASTVALTGLFQLFSRAEGIAHIKDFKLLPELTLQFTKVLNAATVTFGRIIGPLFSVFESLAQWIAPIFQVSRWIIFFTDLLKDFTITVSYVEAVLGGIFEGMKGVFFNLLDWGNYFIDELISIGKPIFDSIKSFFNDYMLNPITNFFSELGISLKAFFFENVVKPIQSLFEGVGGEKFLPEGFKNFASNFNNEFDRIMSENLAALKTPEGPIKQQITNINKVEIRNDFKEQLEPDRIAFTLVEQLKRAAHNPGQGGRTLSAGLVR
jgi:hypothetical protein